MAGNSENVGWYKETERSPGTSVHGKDGLSSLAGGLCSDPALLSVQKLL